METLNIEFATVSSSVLAAKVDKNMEMRSTIAVRFAADDVICPKSLIMLGYRVRPKLGALTVCEESISGLETK